MTAHCLFEQSGTFKNQFRLLGVDSYDYDIQNEFGETDYIIDLFSEIRKAYDGQESVFDTFKKDDIVMAFFPCIRFEDQVCLFFTGEASQLKKYTDEQKLELDLKFEAERSELYELITKLAIVAFRKGFPLVIENPMSGKHYLSLWWSLKPKLVDRDRTANGDYYKKPTQYWFINCEPKHNMVFKTLKHTEVKIIADVKNKTDRSMITQQYANRFIRAHILDARDDNCDPDFCDEDISLFDHWAKKVEK